MNNFPIIEARDGVGCYSFELKISIEECRNLFQIVKESDSLIATTKYWLSYRFIGRVIQSDLFSITSDERLFISTLQTFRIKSEELLSYFNDKKNASTLRIHLCMEGNVIATAAVDLSPVITFERAELRNEYSFKPREKNSEHDQTWCGGNARIVVRCNICRECREETVSISTITERQQQQQLQQQQQQQQQQSKSVAIQTTRAPLETSPVDQIKGSDNFDNSECLREKKLLEKEEKLQMKEEQLSKKEKELALLEKKRCEWERRKNEEELMLREKIKERVLINEKERLASIEKSKAEYETLEKRLHKCLAEVELKDRKLKETQESHQHEHKRKLAELELKEKLMKQEMKHSIEIEQAKAKAALEQVVLVEKSAAAVAKKVRSLEGEIDELREKNRNTPETALLQQLAEYKGQMADSECRIEALKAERSQILAEKEQFRSNVRKLAKALRQERDKVVKRREQSQQNVRLSYDDVSGTFLLGGDQDEVHQILSDLNKLTQKQKQSNRSSPVPLPSPLPSRPLGMDEVLKNINLSFLKESKHVDK